MKKCIYCGEELKDDAKACCNCGRPVDPSLLTDGGETVEKKNGMPVENKNNSDTSGGLSSEQAAERSRLSQPESVGQSGQEENSAVDIPNVPWLAEAQAMDATREAEKRAAEKMAAAEKQKTIQETNTSAGEGPKGYWQFGQWHSIDELNNPNYSAADSNDSFRQNSQNTGFGQTQEGSHIPYGNNTGNDGSFGNHPGNETYRPNNGFYGYSPNQGNSWNSGYGNVPPYGGQGYYQVQKTNGFAIAALILALLSFLLDAVYMIPSLMAIGFGIAALVQIHRQPNLYRGKAMAVAAIVIAAVTFVFYLYIFIMVIQMMQDPEFIKLLEEPNFYENVQEYVEQFTMLIRRMHV